MTPLVVSLEMLRSVRTPSCEKFKCGKMINPLIHLKRSAGAFAMTGAHAWSRFSVYFIQRSSALASLGQKYAMSPTFHVETQKEIMTSPAVVPPACTGLQK